MDNKVVSNVSRRRFLQGAGGFSLALPVMHSLQPRSANAQGAVEPRLFWMTTDHGGAEDDNMFPSDAGLSEQAEIRAGHNVRWGPLNATTQGNTTRLSSVLSANSARLAPLIPKMNVMKGFDVSFYIGHNTGLHLGNYARNDGNSADSGGFVQRHPRPTIDQVMAWSPNFYKDLSIVRERAMVVGTRGAISYNWSNPADRSGSIQPIVTQQSSLNMFRSVFVPNETPDQMNNRPPVVDRVIEAYRTLTQSNRRLSTLDRQRLDDHMQMLSEVQRKLTVTQVSCADLQTPSDDANQHSGNSGSEYAQQGQLWNDVIQAAFSCGTSRIGILGMGSNNRAVGFSGNWHQDVAHQWQSSQGQDRLVSAYQLCFEQVFLDLGEKLNAVTDSNGGSLLDSTLMCWSQEFGMSTHEAVNIPMVTLGSAGGQFKTGNLWDFRNVGNAQSRYMTESGHTFYQGVLYNQWLSNVMLAMGLERPDFELWNHRGYGYPFISPEGWLPWFRNHYQTTSSPYYQIASDKLPGLWA